jgi:DNA modification methylase
MLSTNKIHCGDNCDMLGKMGRACVDLVVTSPPYDDLRTYGGHSWDFYGVAWHLSRVLKPGGVIVWVVADATTKDGSESGSSMEQALHFRRLGLNIHDTMIWSKDGFTDVGSTAVRYGPSSEFMFVLSKGRPKTFNPIKDRKNKTTGVRKSGTIRNADGSMKPMSSIGKEYADFGIRFNVWDIPPERSNLTRIHPAQFPESLARDHIASWSNPGDLVLDPFCGSGTTARAAKDMGRDFVGIEINPVYCALAQERISQEALPIAHRASE